MGSKGSVISAKGPLGPFGMMGGNYLANRLFPGGDAEQAKNYYEPSVGVAQSAIEKALKRGAQDSAGEVMQDPRLAALYGDQGALGRAGREELELSTSGYELKPEDRTAYGQAAGDISRQFGMAEGNLARALASRGLSSSGAGNRAFMGMQGNKMEQLAGIQKQIADARMQSNLQRLGQTRQFMSQLGGMYSNELGRRDDVSMSKGQLGSNILAGATGQANTQLEQRIATKPQDAFRGIAKMAMVGGGAAIGGAAGGPQGAQTGAAAGQGAGSQVPR